MAELLSFVAWHWETVRDEECFQEIGFIMGTDDRFYRGCAKDLL